MRFACVVFALAGAAWAQSMTEAAAAAAGSTVGSVAGKQVSAGVDKIFGKTGDILGKAAKQGDPAAKQPLLKVGPGKPKEASINVPAPPPAPVSQAGTRRAALATAAPTTRPVAQPVYVSPAPPAPPVTQADLATVSAGMARADVLRLGSPASRVTMFDNGHLVEIYRYQTRDAVVGVVRLSDGAVSGVSVNP